MKPSFLKFVALDQQTGEIAVTPEAMSFLGSLPSDQKLAVVSLVGPVSTGKSFLANRILNQNDQQGFPVSDQQFNATGAESNTPGILIWNQPIQISEGVSMLVIDTQGLPAPKTGFSTASMRSPRGKTSAASLRSPRGSPRGSNTSSGPRSPQAPQSIAQKSAEKIFFLTGLLSSILVFNQNGHVGDKLLDFLEPLTKFSDSVSKDQERYMSQQDASLILQQSDASFSGDASARSISASASEITLHCAGEFKEVFCRNLYVVMRDFQPIDLNTTKTSSIFRAQQATSSSVSPNSTSTAKVMLENVLKPTTGLSTGVRKGKIQDCLRKLFPSRDCFALVKPFKPDEDKLCEEFNQGFNKLMTQLKNKLKSQTGLKIPSGCKVVQGKPINGAMLLGLALEYTEAIEQGFQKPGSISLPKQQSQPSGLYQIISAIKRISEEETIRQKDAAYAEFQQTLEEQINEDNMPLPEKDFEKIIKKLRAKTLTQLKFNLADILSFEELLEEIDEFESKIDAVAETKRQENYSQGYHYNLALINQLNPNFQTPDGEKSKSDVFLEAWLNFYMTYKQQDESMPAKFEVFSDCLLGPNSEATFVDYSQVQSMEDEFKQGQSESIDDQADAIETQEQEEMNAEDAKRKQIIKRLRSQQPHLLEILTKQIDTFQAQCQQDLQSSLLLVQDTYHSQQSLEQQKQKNEEEIKKQAAANEALVSQKNDLIIKVQSLETQLESLKQEIGEGEGITEQEKANIKAAFDDKVALLDQEIQDFKHKIQDKRAEVSRLEKEYQKEEQLMTEDIEKTTQQNIEVKKQQEQMELQLKGKKKQSELFDLVSDFFGTESIESINQLKAELTVAEKGKEMKRKLYEDKKKLNQLDFEHSQDELKVKQQADEELMQHKKKLQKEIRDMNAEYEAQKPNLLELQQEQKSLDHQLQMAMHGLVEAKEHNMALKDQMSDTKELVRNSLQNIVQLKEDLAQEHEEQMQMEEKVYELTISNQTKRTEKEMMIELLPEMVKSSHDGGRPTKELVQILNSMDGDLTKAKLLKILQSYKIITTLTTRGTV